jgi:hypothetical protein
MHAVVGDTIAIPGRHVGESGRLGRVIDVRGTDGGPPYVVRWDDGHESVCYPGPESRVSHEGHLDPG